MSRQVLSVSQTNEYIRIMMDKDDVLAGIAVRGEISNYKVYPSGHHYFTLKDEGASLKCVMFRSSAQRLKFQPQNGMKIITMGKISVYPRDGAYQLYCSTMALDGVGNLYAAFEQLKVKLSAKGLFDQSHKKQLPKYPATIGIVTSSAGAAVHDILRILRKRYPLTTVRLLPVRVQGAEAPGEIAAAIDYANYYHLADLLIVGRGGGSIEDLWAFNDEQVALAIYRSDIPVISAVGHEPDFTISDFVADLRAATPSNAAELAVPDQNGLRQLLDAAQASMQAAILKHIYTSRQHLKAISVSPALQNPSQYVNHRRAALSLIQARLLSAQQCTVSIKRQRFASLTAAMDAMSPLKVLSRGYAMVHNRCNELIRTVKQITNNEDVQITLSDGIVSACITDVKENVYE